MKIAVVYQYYQGPGSPGHSLCYELTQFLATRGHSVTVVAGETGYMRCDVPTLPWYRRLLRREQIGKVSVVRTFTYAEAQRNYIKRLVSYLSFSVSCVFGLLAIERPDVVLASSPPIFPMFSSWLVCKLRGIPYVLEVRDLWPASAIQLGILKNPLLIRIMSWMETLLYNQSHKVVAVTEGIHDDICDRGWSREKVALINCGVDETILRPYPEGAQAVRSRYGWTNKKVVLYFGALGEANNIPVILRAAKRMGDRGDVLFVLIGDGMKRVEMERLGGEMALRNVLVLPAAPKEEAASFISAADLCLATLRDIPLFGGAIPTKLLEYMACGRPVLCGVRGEAKRIVEESGAGYAFGPDDDEALSKRISALLDDEQQRGQLGQKGLAYVRERFSALRMRHRMEAVLEEAAGRSHKGGVGQRQMT